MEKCEVSSASLTFFGDDALAGATRSLDLIRKIETTIATLCYDQTFFGNVGNFARAAAETVANSGAKGPIDSEGTAVARLLETQEKVSDLHKHFSRRLKSAREDDRLTSEDGVFDEFVRVIEIVKEAHNAINDLRWAILEHDADLDKPSGPAISDREELRKYLAAI